MIEAHTLDAWTRLDARHNSTYGWAMIVGGFAAPAFLFLAGIALALAAGSRLRRGRTSQEVAALRAPPRAADLRPRVSLPPAVVGDQRRRPRAGAPQGGHPEHHGTVDARGRAAVERWKRSWDRAAWMLAATVAVAMFTPIVRATPMLSPLPDPVEWYVRPIPGRGTFTLFPWSGFLLAGATIGVWLDAARTPAAERRLNLALAAIGLASHRRRICRLVPPGDLPRVVVLDDVADVLFPAPRRSDPVVCPWRTRGTPCGPGRSALQEFGQASLFVYWIHVELAYGVLSSPSTRRSRSGRRSRHTRSSRSRSSARRS